MQSQTSWATSATAIGFVGDHPRDYVAELTEAFHPYVHEPAVKRSEALLNDQKFAYDAPLGFVLTSTNGLGFEEPPEGYGSYLLGRAAGRQGASTPHR